MKDIPGDFGKSFLAAGFIPGLIFIALNDLFVRPLYFSRRLVDIKLLGIEGVGYILGAIILGMLLLAFDGSIVRLYEYGLVPWLSKAWYRRKHKKLYTALGKRRSVYLELRQGGQGDEAQIEKTITELEAIYYKIEEQQGTQQLPFDIKNVMPTALGNAFAAFEEYPYRRYGMDAMIYWQRLAAFIPKEYEQKISDQKTTMDFLLNVSLLTMLLGIEALVVGGINMAPLTVWAGVVALIVAFFPYRGAVKSAFAMGEFVKSCFDLFRADLLDKYGVAMPVTREKEREVWLRLASFVRRGESFYSPTQTVQPESVSEQRCKSAAKAKS